MVSPSRLLCHVSAAAYRLEQSTELTGCSAARPDAAFRVQHAKGFFQFLKRIPLHVSVFMHRPDPYRIVSTRSVFRRFQNQISVRVLVEPLESLGQFLPAEELPRVSDAIIYRPIQHPLLVLIKRQISVLRERLP